MRVTQSTDQKVGSSPSERATYPQAMALITVAKDCTADSRKAGLSQFLTSTRLGAYRAQLIALMLQNDHSSWPSRSR